MSDETSRIVAWLRDRKVQVATIIAAMICAALFQAGGEAFSAMIMGIWALQLAEEVDELRGDHLKDTTHAG